MIGPTSWLNKGLFVDKIMGSLGDEVVPLGLTAVLRRPMQAKGNYSQFCK